MSRLRPGRGRADLIDLDLVERRGLLLRIMAAKGMAAKGVAAEGVLNRPVRQLR
jgi:hypothetical protein